MNSEFSLIYPTPESHALAFAGKNVADISDDTCEQLGLSYLLELKNSSLSEYFTTDAEVMKYRLEGFYDLLDNPELKDALMSVIPILNDIVELRQLDADMSGTTESYLYSITEIELYISCVEKLNEGLTPIREKLTSRSFKAMAERIKTLCESDYYKELNRKLTELTDRVREIKSITVGVNLDSQLRPSSAGVLSINSEQFKSGELLEKILRMSFKNDEYTCIAALVPFGRGQSENTKTALSYAFYSAINDVFKASVKSWKMIVQSYVLDNTDFLIKIMPEIEFMVKGSEMLRKLRERGYPLSVPNVDVSGDVTFRAKGLYNPSVAEQIAESIVKNDLVFDEEARIYVLTGPNRGGKSVITCAAGIAQAMMHLGMPVPADEFTASPADGIYIHFPIGAEDTIDKGRLGEECVRLASVFDKVSRSSLVLLDESFSSTGAYEASYIAAEVILGFCKVGSRVIFATHLHELAARIPEINERSKEIGGYPVDSLVARIENGKRSFRIDREKPDGKSYAGDIADKYGLSYNRIMQRIEASGKED
ncbi:MAG: hypothetical protein E7619_08700 [Ruminococcaceae bacterium]|nr:hypothetical protein [Oscillospiraceae bacterium]